MDKAAVPGGIRRVKGEDGEETGAVGNVESIAWWTHTPEDKVRDAAKVLMNEGMVHFEDDTLIITHYAERQARAPSQTPEAIRERVRKWRAAQSELPAPAGDKSVEFAAALLEYGITVDTDAKATTWQRILKKAGPGLFEKALQEAAEHATGSITPKYVEAIIDGSLRDNRDPGERKGNPAKAEPAPPAPVRWRNPLTEQEEGM